MSVINMFPEDDVALRECARCYGGFYGLLFDDLCNGCEAELAWEHEQEQIEEQYRRDMEALRRYGP